MYLLMKGIKVCNVCWNGVEDIARDLPRPKDEPDAR